MATMLTPPGAALAVLFAAGEPLGKKQLASLIGVSAADLQPILDTLEKSLSVGGLALVEVADEVELRTGPEAAPLVKKLWEGERGRDLGKAGLETLAVIAYQDGATRGDVDWVRGVNSSASIRTLLLRGLIEGSEDPEDKRRIRYALTTEALGYLGLSRSAELPRYGELAREAKNVITVGASGEDA